MTLCHLKKKNIWVFEVNINLRKKNQLAGMLEQNINLNNTCKFLQVMQQSEIVRRSPVSVTRNIIVIQLYISYIVCRKSN